MKRYSKVVFGAATAVLAAVVTGAPASADPETCTVYGPNNTMTCTPLAPTTTAPATSSGSSAGGITAWIDQHMPLLIGIGLVVIGLVIWSSVAKEKAQQKQRRESAGLARGRAVALAHHAEAMAAARAAAHTAMPPREAWDPHGLGLAPPAVPEPALPDPPPMSDDDLRRYAAFGWTVPFVPGTAFAAVVGRDGNLARVEAAWLEAAELAGLGEIDPETGKFVAAATVATVNGLADNSGDVLVSVDTRDYTTGAAQLDRVLPHLLRTARVATASRFERDPASDHFTTRLSMNAAAAPTTQNPAPEPEQPRVDPRWS